MEARGDHATDDLAKHRDGNGGNDIGPTDTIIKSTNIDVKTSKRKVKREQNKSDKVLNLFSQLDDKVVLTRNDSACQEGSENGMDANDICVKGRNKS